MGAVVVLGDRNAPEPPYEGIDPEPELPDRLWDGGDALIRLVRMAAVKHDGDSREDDGRAANEPEPGQGSWYEPGGIHQISQNEAVPPADDESGPEDERPVLQRRQRV